MIPVVEKKTGATASVELHKTGLPRLEMPEWAQDTAGLTPHMIIALDTLAATETEKALAQDQVRGYTP